MPDELNGVPGDPTGVSPGQPQPTAEGQETQPPAPAKVNLNDLDEFRQWQSKKDREVAEANRAAQEAADAADYLRQQNAALLDTVERTQGRDARDQAEQVLASQAVVYERDYYKQQVEVTNFHQAWDSWASDKGIDPSSPAYKEAKAQAWNGSPAAMYELEANAKAEARAKVLAAEMLKQMSAQQAPPAEPVPSSSPSPQPSTSQQRPGANVILPPSGGGVHTASQARIDQLWEELGDLQREPTKNKAQIDAIHAQIKSLGG